MLPAGLIHRSDSKYNPAGGRPPRDETNHTRSPMPIDPSNENTPAHAGIRRMLASGLRGPTGYF